MIQRLQSIYLALGVLALAGWLFWNADLMHGPVAEQMAWFGPGLVITGGLAGLTGLVAIFLYKDAHHPKNLLPGLRRQRKIVITAQFITLLLACILYFGLFLARALPVAKDIGGMISLAGPPFGYLLFYMARRGIDRDITELKKSNEFRLRD